MAGLTAEGLVIKRYADILAEKRARAVTRFLDLVPPGDEVDTSDSSTLGRLIALSIPGEADLWEAVQEVFDAFNPNAAEGIALDNLVALGGIERFQESFSTVQAVFTGDAGTFISQGSTVRATTTSTNWSVVGGGVALDASRATGVRLDVSLVQPSTLYTISFDTGFQMFTGAYTSDSTPTVQEILNGLRNSLEVDAPSLNARIEGERLVVNNSEVFSEGSWTTSSNLSIVKVDKVGTLVAEQAGPIQQAPNTITNISTPVLGWDSVSNPVAATPGRWRETDEDLRDRFRNSKFERAGNILEALYTALNGIDNVRQVVIYENDTDQTDANGIPAHSFMPVVLGGDPLEIAERIWENKPLGIGSYGNTEVTIVDSQFFPHAIRFERPSPVPIFITVNLTIGEEFPADGAARIRDELVNYINSLNIGDGIIYSRLYTPINRVQGHQVDSLYIGTSPSPTSSSNINIPFNQIASIDPSNIVVNT